MSQPENKLTAQIYASLLKARAAQWDIEIPDHMAQVAGEILSEKEKRLDRRQTKKKKQSTK